MTSRFFPPAEPQALGTIAAALQAELVGGDPEAIVTDVRPLDSAGPEHLTFVRSSKLRRALQATKAGAVLCEPRLKDDVPVGTAALLTPYPGNMFGLAAGLFHPSAMRPHPITTRQGAEIAPSAVVEDPDGLEANVIVEANAVIARGVEIGRGSVIGPNVVIGPNCTIGRGCHIGASSTIQCAHIGDRVILHPGVRIGQDGFGLARAPDGYRKVPQVGAVVIQDDVELGANTTVDRGSLRDTVIGKGTKIDNQCQVAHNVVIGVHTVIAGCTGISGSTTVGDNCRIGGHVGLSDGITIGHNVSIGGKAGVGEDIPDNETWTGYPAMEISRYIALYREFKRIVRRNRAS